MQNLIRLFQKYLFVFVFIFLQALCLVFIVTGNNKFHSASIANSSNAVVGGIYEWSHGVVEYFGLREQNTKLLEENARLQEQLLSYKLIEVKDSVVKVIDSTLNISYHLMGGSVINSTLNLRKNYLTLNVGEHDNIKPNMAVIGLKGVIGYVLETSANYSVVMPIINEQFKLPVSHNVSNSFGLISWMPDDGYQTASVIDIPISVPVAIGDTIFTRGSDAMFPKGILVGIVEKVDNETGQSFQIIKVKLTEDFSSINKVKIIHFINQDQINRLESNYY